MQPDIAFHDTLGLRAPTQVDAAAAKAAAINLVTKRRGTLDAYMPQQNLPGLTGGIAQQFGRAGGVHFTISRHVAPGAAAGFQALSPEDIERPFSSLAAGKAVLKLVASALSTGTAAPHCQMVKVRLKGIRCWLHGYRVCDWADADGLVHVQLTPTGDSMDVIDAAGTTDSRTHDPVTRDLICHAVATGTNDDC